MAAEHHIPAEVLRFIDENIDTVPQLETLLLLSESEDTGWLASDVAARTYTSHAHAEQTLDALRRRGLVAFAEAPARFRYWPATDEVRARVAEVARSYRENLSRIATYIHSKPSVSIKEFARAFDLKKER